MRLRRFDIVKVDGNGHTWAHEKEAGDWVMAEDAVEMAAALSACGVPELPEGMRWLAAGEDAGQAGVLVYDAHTARWWPTSRQMRAYRPGNHTPMCRPIDGEAT